MSKAAERVDSVAVRVVDGLALLDAGAGPAVVCVPGYTGSKEDFGSLLEPLAAAGYRVLAYDQPGQYESPGPPDTTAYVPAALAQRLLGLLDALDIDAAHLVGHSYGGLVARAAVLARPAAVASLTLLDSGPAALQGQRASVMRALRPVLQEAGVPAVWSLMERSGATTPFAKERFLAHTPASMLGMGDALLAEPDRVSELAAVCRRHRIPVLVAAGVEDDAWSPAQQLAMAAELAAPFVAIPGAEHSPAVENPAATVAALLAFYASVSDAPALPLAD